MREGDDDSDRDEHGRGRRGQNRAADQRPGPGADPESRLERSEQPESRRSQHAADRDPDGRVSGCVGPTVPGDHCGLHLSSAGTAGATHAASSRM